MSMARCTRFRSPPESDAHQGRAGDISQRGRSAERSGKPRHLETVSLRAGDPRTPDCAQGLLEAVTSMWIGRSTTDSHQPHRAVTAPRPVPPADSSPIGLGCPQRHRNSDPSTRL